MCPVQFQSLLVYSEMNLKWNGDIASPCCRLFWRGNISDMFAFLDSIVCFFEHVLIDVTNFVDMPCWMRMYKIFHSNRLMFCYIAFAFSLLVLMNAEYVISMWSIMLKITPIAIFFFFGGGGRCVWSVLQTYTVYAKSNMMPECIAGWCKPKACLVVGGSLSYKYKYTLFVRNSWN
jgi:hypothetical protein